jgi:sec-independent protein translocase protein TatA
LALVVDDEKESTMGTPGMWELIIILVIVLVIFGTGKLASVGGSLGTAIREFKQTIKGGEEDEAESTETPEKDESEKA